MGLAGYVDNVHLINLIESFRYAGRETVWW